MNSSIDKVKEQVMDKTPKIVVEAIAAQLDRLDEAKRRIREEGIVVRDLKGAVVAHPAIKIEQDTTKIVVALLREHKKG